MRAKAIIHKKAFPLAARGLWRKYYRAIQSGDLESALDAAQEAERIFRNKSDRRHSSILRRAVSNVLFLQGHHAEALKAAEKSIKLAARDDYERALSISWLAAMNSMLGNTQQALSQFEDAVKIAECFTTDSYLWSYIFGARAAAFRRSGSYDRALLDWQGAAAMLEKDGQLWRAAAYLNNMGWLLAQIGRSDEAQAILLNALEFVGRDPHLTTKAAILDSLGYVLGRAGNHVGAIRALQKAVRYFEKLGDQKELAKARLHLADLFNTTGNASRASGEIASVVNIARSLADKSLLDQAEARLNTLDVNTKARTAGISHQTDGKLMGQFSRGFNV